MKPVLLLKLIALADTGAGMPTAFRLFKAGENETTKGVFTFDAKAAELVMAAAKERGGVDYPIDLEHLSLDDNGRNFDPDARGWFKLEVRNGELWAVDVRWTPDGERRLSEKTQRYVSPAFMTDDEGRITEIVNVALVAMPATHGTPALVAANRSKPRMKLKSIAALTARLSIAKDKLQKLADDGGGDAAPAGKFAQAKSAADAAAQALADFEKASGGSDVDATFAAMDAAVKACDAFEQAVAAIAGGASAPSDDPAPAAASDAPQQDAQKMARLEAEIVTLRKEKEARDHAEQVQKLAAEHEERKALEGELVKLGRETPATVKLLAAMPLESLRERVKLFGGSPSRSVTLGRVAPPEGGGAIEGGVQTMTDAEVTYLRARHAQLVADGMKLRSFDETLARYGKKKAQQMLGAREKGDVAVERELAKPVERVMLSYGSRAGLVTLSTPVQPFEEFGASSQIALQNFRLEYNLALASIPGGWAETVGKVLPDGSMKTTYPLNFRALQYKEKTAQNAATGQPQNVDIEVTQREFFEGQMIELRRLVKGDFAYIQSWAQLAQDLARARIFLRDELVAALLAGATAGYWGQSAKYATGIDGQPYFSGTHAINPFDPSKQLRGVSTFANYQSTISPLNADNLTNEKNQALQVAAPDGRELGIRFDGILYPSVLEQTTYNLLKVQDLILDAGTVNGVASAFGQVRNPHFNSGLEMTRAQQLAGTTTGANWYLYSREAIARGLQPWVIAEDPTEEVRLFDENSDFYKSTGFIKYESHVFLNAVLLYPHAIRLIKGS